MRRPTVSDNQLLLIMKMCADAEQRCDERFASARESGDYAAAADAVRLKQHYEDLKQRLYTEMYREGATTGDLHEQLQDFVKYIDQTISGGNRP